MAFLDSIKNAVNQIDGSNFFGDGLKRDQEQKLQQSPPVSTPPAPIQDSDEEAIYSPKIEKLIKMALADGDLTEKEKQVLFKQAEEEGKPAKIIDRMVEGRINKFYKEVCLNEQESVIDPDKTIADILGDVKVTEFTRFQLGEGIEKKQEDFAAEVAAQMK